MADVVVIPNPLAPGAPYHVDACGLAPNREATIDTTGPGTFFTRETYPVGDDHCAHYDAVAGDIPGEYLLTVQQFSEHGPDYQPGAVKGTATFTVA